VSLATIDEDAPFSAFPGYERAIILAEGVGFELRAAGSVIRVDRSQPIAAFSGDLSLHCTLLEGPVRALNLITDRVRLRASAEILDLAHPSPRREGVVVCFEGSVRVDGSALQRYDAAVIEHAEVAAASAAARAAFLALLPVQ
jgi:environmental stress-induced protein Ves